MFLGSHLKNRQHCISYKMITHQHIILKKGRTLLGLKPYLINGCEYRLIFWEENKIRLNQGFCLNLFKKFNYASYFKKRWIK